LRPCLLSSPHPLGWAGRVRISEDALTGSFIGQERDVSGTGCQWNQLPEKFGSDSTVHRTLQRWDERGIFDNVWALLIYHCQDLADVHWEWQAADGCLHKARFIGTGAKGGIKRASQKSGVRRPRRKRQDGESVPIPVTEEKCQRECPCRGARRSALCLCRRSQCKRPSALGCHPGRYRGGASGAKPGNAATPVPGQGI
jgi:transposase